MSSFTLERTRIRVFKQILRDGFHGRRQARLLLEEARAEAGEWRTPERLASDFPGLPETTRFLRGIAGKMRDPANALRRLQSLLEQDEGRLNRQLAELTECLLQSETPGAQRELEAFLQELGEPGASRPSPAPAHSVGTAARV